MAGGLISYGSELLSDTQRWAAVYAGRILRGEKPGDHPVSRSRPELILLSISPPLRRFRLEIPAQLLARAGEVIE